MIIKYALIWSTSNNHLCWATSCGTFRHWYTGRKVCKYSCAKLPSSICADSLITNESNNLKNWELILAGMDFRLGKVLMDPTKNSKFCKVSIKSKSHPIRHGSHILEVNIWRKRTKKMSKNILIGRFCDF